MNEPTSGTVTFLFTDVEGSTRLLQRHAHAMGDALATHHRLLRESVEEQAGRVFETIGDAVYASFDDPQRAVRAALLAQLRLRQQDWREIGRLAVRMAIHTGEVERRGEHFFGMPLFRAARLLASGHGEQTLISEATAQLLRGSLPRNVQLISLGKHRLKDFPDVEEIFQVAHSELPREFPHLRSAGTLAHNLPSQLTSFIGRERELSEARALLSRHRIVSITGAGGVGKTRLALQLAHELIPTFEDGVFFVSLAPLQDPALVIPTIAAALGLKEASGSPADRLKEHLRDKQLLLVLDNFEQVAGAAPEIVRILGECPALRALVTSRAALRASGEQELALQPLPVPKGSWLAPEIAENEAVRLFVERARALRSDYVLDGDAQTVAEICRRLEGLPLAIELAAARTRLLLPEEMLHRMARTLDVLTTGPRDSPVRHRSLRSTIDWSFQLLTASERTLFISLSVFAGGCTLEAIEAVCRGDSAMNVLEGVESLLNSSLIQRVSGADGQPRFRMLETIREYGLEQLAATGAADSVRQRHMNHYLTFAEQAEPELAGPKEAWWLARLEAEYDNLRAALSASIERTPVIALRLVVASWGFWLLRGHVSEARTWLQQGLRDREHIPKPLLARALSVAGNLARNQGDYAAAREVLEDSLILSRDLGDKHRIAMALTNLGIVAARQGDYAAAFSLWEEALAIRREQGDARGIAANLLTMGAVAAYWGDLARARSLWEESLTISRSSGGDNVAVVLNNLGSLSEIEGNYSQARSLFEESMAAARVLGYRRGIALAIANLGELSLREGEYVGSRRLLEESLRMMREFGDKYFTAQITCTLGELAFREADHSTAYSLYVESLKARLSLGDKAGIASCLDAFAQLAAAQGELSRGATLFGAAEMLNRAIGQRRSGVYSAEHDKNVNGVRSQLGEPAFADAWKAGEALSSDEAVSLALGSAPNVRA